MKKIILAIIFCGYFLFAQSSSAFDAQDLKRMFEEGVLAYNQEDYKKAIPIFEKTIEIYPLAQAYNYLGLSKRSVGEDLNTVALLFKKAVELEPNFAEGYENLGKTYYALSNFPEAETYAQKAVDLNPASVSARLSLAWIQLLGFSKGGEAIGHFEYALQYSDIPYSYFGLGMAYVLTEQKFKALEMITTLRQRGEENMALQLEKMVSDGSSGGFLRNEAPVLIPNPAPSILVSEGPDADTQSSTSNNAHKNMKVRLSTSPINNTPSSQALPPAQTGQERLQQLQGSGKY